MQAIELFKASDKYDVDGLQRECIHVFQKITQARHVAFLLQVFLVLHFFTFQQIFADCLQDPAIKISGGIIYRAYTLLLDQLHEHVHCQKHLENPVEIAQPLQDNCKLELPAGL